jgi:hypothetical protein
MIQQFYLDRGYAKKAKGDLAGADADFAAANKLLPPYGFVPSF